MRGSGSIEELLPTLSVSGQASVDGEGRVFLLLRVSIVVVAACGVRLPRLTLVTVDSRRL